MSITTELRELTHNFHRAVRVIDDVENRVLALAGDLAPTVQKLEVLELRLDNLVDALERQEPRAADPRTANEPATL